MHKDLKNNFLLIVQYYIGHVRKWIHCHSSQVQLIPLCYFCRRILLLFSLSNTILIIRLKFSFFPFCFKTLRFWLLNKNIKSLSSVFRKICFFYPLTLEKYAILAIYLYKICNFGPLSKDMWRLLGSFATFCKNNGIKMFFLLGAKITTF